MDEGLHEPKKLADVEDDSNDGLAWKVVAAGPVWLFFFTLALMNRDCMVLPHLPMDCLLIGVAVAVSSAVVKFLCRGNDAEKRTASDEREPAPNRDFAHMLAMFVGIALCTMVACMILLGEFVRLSSNVTHDYDTAVIAVRHPKRDCKSQVNFIDPILQSTVTECVQGFDNVRPGMLVHVQALSGPLGVRFLSVKRAIAE
ncbi:MAG TPA: hypothetical protein VIF60_15375 [Burkholderiaceae bacterium]|jgi:hypothetical protein